MSPPRLTLLPLLLLLAFATAASAQRVQSYRPAPAVSSPELEQAIYKGVVGNALDVVPMDPAKRVDLQRINTVVTSTVSGRSLAALTGLSNPVLLIGGLFWGMWAASNIKAVEDGIKPVAASGQSRGGDAQTRAAALVAPAAAVDDAPDYSRYEPVLASSNSAEYADRAAPARPPVIKIWLPQRSSIQ